MTMPIFKPTPATSEDLLTASPDDPPRAVPAIAPKPARVPPGALSRSTAVSLISTVHEVGMAFARDGGAAPLFETLLDAMLAVLRADAGQVLLTGTERRDLRVVAQRGLPSALADGPVPPATAAVCAAALANAARIMVADLRGSRRDEDGRSELLLGAGFGACHATPMIAPAGEPSGVVVLYFRAAPRIAEAQLQLADVLARDAAGYVELTRTRQAAELAIAAERRHRERAEAASRSKDEFLATLSHELRQPLGAIFAALEVQKRTGKASGDHRARTVIEQQIGHIARLVDDLADASRITRGAIELRLEPADVRAIVADALQTASPAIERRRHRTTVETGREPAVARVDAARMRQVFSNLLQNAAAYTPDGGDIRVAVRTVDDRILVSVRDNGEGIEHGALDRIFDLYARGSDEGATVSAGIGLSVVKRLVELQGGSVTASSEGHGRGAEFVVALPVAPRPEHSANS